jgi:MFS family permease
LASQSLFTTLKNLRGNPRASVYTEPLWGIPYNLYAPYFSVYMLALGLTDQQIGLLVSIGLGFQILFGLLSGAITDKLGRKRTTFWFDIISWSIPCLIWAVAQNFTYFLIAAIINSLWRITANSWSCMLVEDANQDDLVHIFSWVYIAGLFAAFFAPIAGLLVRTYSLVPAVRALFVFSFIMMTAKFVVFNHFVTETRQGEIRLKETHHQPLFSLLKGYKGVFFEILRTRQTLFALGIMVTTSICHMITGTFWSILVTEKLLIPVEDIALYPFVRSSVMMLLYFLLIPRLQRRRSQTPMLLGLAGLIAAQALLISMPEKNYVLLVVATIIEAGSLALFNPFVDTMVVNSVNPAERARIMAILFVIVISLTSPFGWIVGRISEINRIYPFLLSIGLFMICAILIALAHRRPAEKIGPSLESGA